MVVFLGDYKEVDAILLQLMFLHLIIMIKYCCVRVHLIYKAMKLPFG